MADSWKKLDERLATLPPLLVGPILRQVDEGSVTVWIALKKEANVTLTVEDCAHVTVMQGIEHTVPLGKHLHVLAVTARPVFSLELGGGLQAGRLYFYKLQADNTDIDLSAFKLHSKNVSWPNLPSFCMPPADPWDVRILHGSCRKPHGEGRDALAHVEEVVATARDHATPEKVSPHMLLLTGDQIYADDVADALLHMLIDANKTLLSWTKQEIAGGHDASCKEASLRPGMRTKVVEKEANFTAMVGGEKEVAKSHLLFFGEYLTMYLFVWSDVLWDATIPTVSQVFENPTLLNDEELQRFEQECSRLAAFRDTLPAVRRGLANIPTYMIFDDHEVTDDWFLDLAWCERVLQKVLGRRSITNALAAYAVCQAWGNTPDRFSNGMPGRKLLEALAQLTENADTEEPWVDLRSVLRIPTWQGVSDISGLGLPDENVHLFWPFIVLGPAVNVDGVKRSRFAVLFLDTRTTRYFPRGGNGKGVDYAELIGEDALDQQLALIPKGLDIGGSCDYCIVVSPAPVIGIELVEQYVQPALSGSKTPEELFEWDMEAWGFQPTAVDRLLDGLAKLTSVSFDPDANVPGAHRGRYLLLGGDVHYAFSFRLQYWKESLGPPPNYPTNTIFAQLTSSSLRNEDKKTRFMGSALGTEALVGVAKDEPLTIKTEVIARLSEAVMATLGTAVWVNIRFALLCVQYLAHCGAARVDSGLSWRIDSIKDKRVVEETAWTPTKVPVPLTGSRKEALEGYLNMSMNSKEYLQQGGGHVIVGANNFGEIRFDGAHSGTGSPPDLVHSLWWSLKKEAGDPKLWVDLAPFPLTEHRISLKFDDPRYPKPHST